MAIAGINNIGGADGGLTPEEHNALKSIAYYPTSGIQDINPTKLTGQWIYGLWLGGGSGAQKVFKSMPVKGYDKVAVYNNGGSAYTFTIDYYDTHGKKITSQTSISVPSASWSSYIDIPEDAVFLYIHTTWYSSNTLYGSYSLLTADSPYNPDNQ